jgi:ABC-type sugar transport system substrate-binding protein
LIKSLGLPEKIFKEILEPSSLIGPIKENENLKLKNKIDLIAVASHDIASAVATVKEDAQDFLEDGSLDVGVLWDPAKLGYLTVGVAKTMLEGNELKDGMEIEGFGEVRVQDDGKTIIMGPPDDYTK